MEEKKDQVKLKAGFGSEEKILLIKVESQSKLIDQDIVRALTQYLSMGCKVSNGKSNWTQENCLRSVVGSSTERQ